MASCTTWSISSGSSRNIPQERVVVERVAGTGPPPLSAHPPEGDVDDRALGGSGPQTPGLAGPRHPRGVIGVSLDSTGRLGDDDGPPPGQVGWHLSRLAP